VNALRRAMLAGGLAAVVSCAAPAAPVAASADGRWRVEGRDGAVQVYDGARLAKSLPAQRLGGGERAAVIDVHFLPARRSFVIAFDTLPGLWELSIDPDAPPVYDGLVHDWRLGEAIGAPGFLGVRRTPLSALARELRPDPGDAARVSARLGEAWWIVHLDVRRPIVRLEREP
jgi:hypothetical protein